MRWIKAKIPVLVTLAAAPKPFHPALPKPMPDICLSAVTVTTLSPLGFWLEFQDEELYLPFVEFPWFEHATVAQICNVQCPSSTRLYWPALDVDLSVAAIRNPAANPIHAMSYDY